MNQEDDNVLKQRTIDRMKTKVMAERREREKKLKNDTSGYDRSFHMLNQFNQMKKIAANQSFINKGN
jgi:hypothetical protein